MPGMAQRCPSPVGQKRDAEEQDWNDQVEERRLRRTEAYERKKQKISIYCAVVELLHDLPLPRVAARAALLVVLDRQLQRRQPIREVLLVRGARALDVPEGLGLAGAGAAAAALDVPEGLG